MAETTLKKNDIFISYGRAESKAFATKLHNKLTECGMNVWFDQNDIPLGIDFQDQIDAGIEKAGNFIFIIAPHAIKSEYCLKEILLAIKHHKRIIPILHIEPQEKEEWNQLHPLISKLNWVYMRQKFDGKQAQEAFGDIDNFNESFDALIKLLSTHKEYVNQHSEILINALTWERNKKQYKHLLETEELTEAKKWMDVKFKNTLPPCSPSPLHAEYICESIKLSQKGHTEVFFSYAREDYEIQQMIRTELVLNGFTTWSDTTDIKTGDKFEEAIRKGVEQADNVVFLISPHSIVSEYCLLELKYVRKYNKRLIPILIKKTEEDKVPADVRTIQYIDLLDNYAKDEIAEQGKKTAFQEDIDQLIATLKTDYEYYKKHKTILVNALKWENNGQPANLLLHGFDLETSGEWIEANKKRVENPPTGLHKNFIHKSQTSRISVFISYGRRHSKDIASRLHNRLNEDGYNVWFDQNDIPLGVDFQQQIDSGIENSDNFIYIISPHSVASEYCLKEVVLASNLNKRIIPILHVEPTEVWNQMHPVIGKLNWIYFREQEDFSIPLNEWKALDDFDNAYKGLNGLLQLHADFVKQHTYYLTRALEWSRNQKDNTYVLVGNDRQKSEDWLNTHFKNEQPPVFPTELHADFICESKTNANNMMTEVFFCYSREDNEVKNKLINALQRFGITTWADVKDISKGESYSEAIEEGIEQADNFFFLISPTSVKSEFCLKELNYVLTFNKRIIPILIEKTNEKTIPDSLKKLEWVDISTIEEEQEEETTTVLSMQERIEKDVKSRKGKTEFEKKTDELLKKLREDKQYHNQHKVFLAKALKWQRQNYNPSIMLRGYNLQNAEAWLKIGLTKRANKPTPIHEKFIAESRENESDITTEIFLSYSRANSDFARRLNDSFQTQGKTTWFDQESIASGSDFAAEINKGIETSDNFVFVISPRSIKSPYCDMEVEYAKKFNKRFITILYEDIEVEDLHPDLAAVQWIDFRPSEVDYHNALSDLLRTIDVDREHVQLHTKWLNRAKEWEVNGKKNDRLLRGEEYNIADKWYNEALDKNKTPRITPLQEEFINKSNEAILAILRREKRMKRLKQLLLIVSVVLMIVAIILAIYAMQTAKVARKSEQQAIKSEKQAKISEALAKSEKEAADKARENAEKDRKKAIAAKNEANKEREKALNAEATANKERDKAKKAEEEALKEKEKALAATTRAEKAKKETDNANAKAMFHLFVFNAKELANKSIRLSENKKNHKTKSLLALTAYELRLQADERGTKRKYPTDYDPTILESLQKAYFLHTKDNLFKSPTWAIGRAGQNFIFSGGEGLLVQTQMNEKQDYDLVDFVEKKRINFSPKGFIRAQHTIPSSKKTYFGTSNGYVFEFDEGSDECKQLYNHGGSNVTAIVALHNDNLLVSTSSNKHITVWNTKENKLVETIKSGKLLNAMAQAGRKIIVGATEKGNLYRMAINNTIDTSVVILETPIFSLCYNEKYNWLVGGGINGEIIKIAGLDKGTTPTISNFPKQHKGVVSAIAFSPDNNWMATSCFDGSIMLWNLSEIMEKGIEKIVPINIQQDEKVLSLNFDSSSKYLIFGDNRKIKIRPVDETIIYKKLRAKFGDDKLSKEEWMYYKKGDLENEDQYYK